MKSLTPGCITSLNGLKQALAWSFRGYHISFDRRENMILMLYPEDFKSDFKEKIAAALADEIKDKVQIRQISKYQRFINWLARRLTGGCY